MSSIEKKRILLTRSEEDNAVWAEGLAERGATALSFPCLRREFLHERAGELRAAIAACAWIAFCSRHAVSAVATLAQGAWPGGPRIACVGPITAARAEAAFETPALVAPLGTAASLAETLLERLEQDQRVLLVAAEEGRPEFEERFRAAGRSVERIAVYRTVAVPGEPAELLPATDAIFFASPSAVRAFAARFSPPPRAPVITLGPTTTEAVREAGWSVAAESNTRDLTGMIEAAERAWAAESSPLTNHE